MNNHTNNRLEFIKKLPIFDNLSIENIENILALSSIFNIKKNSKLFLKDEEIKYFHIIVKGSAILYDNSLDGNQNILQFVKKREIIGDDTIVMHLRSGDNYHRVFDPPTNYVPNPLTYYLNLIESFDKCILITEPDKDNPIIHELY